MKHRADFAFQVVAMAALAVALATLAALVADVMADGAGRLSWRFLTGLPSRRPENAGIYHALAGSIWVMVLTAALPSASNVSLLAERFGADNGRIARIILVTTAVAFLTFSGAVTLLT